MSTCPCCADLLLRHVRRDDTYWFCSSCRQEMPTASKSLGNIGVLHLPVPSLKTIPQLTLVEAIAPKPSMPSAS
ncbi:MAG: hypothetical protein WBA10_09245 [Elainellaceae cyanobacterium]